MCYNADANHANHVMVRLRSNGAVVLVVRFAHRWALMAEPLSRLLPSRIRDGGRRQFASGDPRMCDFAGHGRNASRHETAWVRAAPLKRRG
eukprot:2757633-Alexandrium_andersonii.AAC.1